MNNKKEKCIDDDHCRARLYELFINAIPVFHPSMPTDSRHLMSKKFSDQFEERWRTSFDDELGEQKYLDDKTQMLDYIIWLQNFYNNVGANASIEEGENSVVLRISNCPWMIGDQDNPIFFLICRTIFSRSFSWTNMACQTKQACKRMDETDNCVFEIFTI